MSKKLCPLVLALVIFGCGSEATKPSEQSMLTGSVSTLRTAKDGESKPVANAKVVAPDGQKALTDEKGAFRVAFDEKGSGPIKVASDTTAPLQKPAPKQAKGKSSLRADLQVKSFDALSTIDPW